MLPGFGLSEATLVSLLVAAITLAYNAGRISARVDKVEESVRAIHRRMDELRETIVAEIDRGLTRAQHGR